MERRGLSATTVSPADALAAHVRAQAAIRMPPTKECSEWPARAPEARCGFARARQLAYPRANVPV